MKRAPMVRLDRDRLADGRPVEVPVARPTSEQVVERIPGPADEVGGVTPDLGDD